MTTGPFWAYIRRSVGRRRTFEWPAALLLRFRGGRDKRLLVCEQGETVELVVSGSHHSFGHAVQIIEFVGRNDLSV